MQTSANMLGIVVCQAFNSALFFFLDSYTPFGLRGGLLETNPRCEEYSHSKKTISLRGDEESLGSPRDLLEYEP